jgi:prepilin-type N-terminal cleavage/methylation domain-containing protein
MALNTQPTSLNSARNRRRRDDGFTLVEIVVGMTITGLIVTAMTLAYTTFLRSYPQAVNRVAVSKDVMFVQAWLPIDMASATSIETDPLFQPSTTQTLGGTNVLAITRQDLQSAGHPNYYVNYRYELRDGEWVLVRYEIHNPGSTDPSNPEDVTVVGIAHQLAQPDVDPTWDPTKAPTFAVDVTGRNPGRLRKVGNDVRVSFIDGTFYDTGGAGLGPGSLLTDVTNGGFVNPSSPPSRCGGRITLVLDTSSSLKAQLPTVKKAAKDFLDGFVGTPTQMRIVEFDAIGKPVSPNTWNGPAIDMLNLTGPQIAAVKAQIDAIDNNTGGTNWEAGLRIAMTDFSNQIAITPSPSLPDTVVFFTDGEPFNYIDGAGVSRSTNSANAVEEAKTVSNQKAPWGVTIKGVFVQNNSQSEGSNRLEEARERMRQIVGTTDWEPGPPGPDGKATVGNADAASMFYTTDFAELSNIFTQIFVSDCGGTVTVQRRENGSPTDPVSTGTYEYSTDTGVGTLRAASANSITFDYELDSGSSRWVTIVEQGASGEDIVDVRCYHNGIDVTADRVQPLFEPDPTTNVDVEVTSGRQVKVVANEALSCLFIGG